MNDFDILVVSRPSPSNEVTRLTPHSCQRSHEIERKVRDVFTGNRYMSIHDPDLRPVGSPFAWRISMRVSGQIGRKVHDFADLLGSTAK